MPLSAALGAARFPPQVVQLGFGPNADGDLTITASTFGKSTIELDSNKLQLFARPYAVATNASRTWRLDATIGSAVTGMPSAFSLTHPLPYIVQNFSMPVTLTRAPSVPGIYDVWARALDGFAEAQGGIDVPVYKRGGFTEAFPFQLSWPDESEHDRALARLRQKLVGRLVYGYGGIAFSCRPEWTKFYPASTPVRVRSIERERGAIAWMGTGKAALAPYVLGQGFIAFDPLAIVVEEPSAAPHPVLGTNFGVGGKTEECPAIELADWQIDTTLSLQPPPAGTSDVPPPLHVGMPRDEVVWTRGYPNEVGTRAALRAESTWHYGVAMSRYSITFESDRVASFTTPSNM